MTYESVIPLSFRGKPLSAIAAPGAACEQVNTEYVQTVHASKSLLETLIRNHSLISLDYTPLETFAKEQSVRIVHDVLRRLNTLILSKDDVKEHVENVVASFWLYKRRHSLEGAVMAMRCLRAFILAIGDLCYLLESAGGHPMTNWEECTKLCESQVRHRSSIVAISLCTRPSKHLSNYALSDAKRSDSSAALQMP